MVSHGKFVAYYRVSTLKQGKSGVGVEGQRRAVETYLNGGRWKVIQEFTEVESGRRSDRPELDKALAAARVHRAAVVVAKVDRLTRSVAFLSRLLEAGVEVRFADLPAIDGPTGRFMLQQMASVAELEAGLISTRTKAALAAAKARGTKLGRNRGAKPQRAAGRAFLERRARARAKDLAPALAEIVSDGAKSLCEIAQTLNERGIPTARSSSWTATQVARYS
jgi:DNA invertase Pin-like site-specific DNA recombinase